MSALSCLIPFLLFTVVLEALQWLFSYIITLILATGSGMIFVWCAQRPGDVSAVATALSYLLAFLVVFGYVKQDLVWQKQRTQRMEQQESLQLTMERTEQTDPDEEEDERQQRQEEAKVQAAKEKWKITTPYLVSSDYKLMAAALFCIVAVLLSLGIEELYSLSGVTEGSTDLSGLFPAFAIAVYGLFTPFVEELVFRVTTYSRLLRLTKAPVPLCMLFSALLFGLFHGNLAQGIYATLMGLVFVLALEITGEFVTSFAMHAFCNTASLVFAYRGIGVTWSSCVLLLVCGAAGLVLTLQLCRRVRVDAWKK